MRPGTRIRLVGSTWSSAAPPRRKLSQSLAAWFSRAGSSLPTGSASLGGSAAALYQSVARNALAIPSQSQQQQQQQPPLPQKQGLLRLDRVRFTVALGLTVLAAALAMAWDVVQRQPRRPPAARHPRRAGGADPAAAAYGLDGAGANGHEQPPSALAGVRAGVTVGSGEGAQAGEGGGGSDNEGRGGGASSGGGGIVDDSTAEVKSSALEEAVFAHAAWRYSPRLPAGYLFGWPVLAGAGCRGLPGATTGQPGSNSSGPSMVPGGGKDSSQTPLPAAASATGCGSTATTSPGARRAGGVLSRMGVRAAAAAAEHVLAATEEGLLLTFAVPAGTDRNDSNSSSSNHTTRYGQLGRGGRPDRPGVVWELAEEAVVAVAAGRWHSVAVTESGRVYSWGRNHRGQLGRWPGTQRGAMRPGRVLGALAQQHVVAVSAGPYFTLAVTDMGAVYTWGLNWLMADAPWTAEKEEEDVEMVTQAEASNASSKHVAAAAAAAAAARLGAEPRRVGGVLEGKEVVEVDCGVVHWVGRLKNGSVFTCSTGFSAHGTKPTDEGYFAAQAPFLGRKVTTAAEAAAPRLLPIQAVSVAASANATFAVAHNFSLLSWGISSPVLGRQDPAPLPAAVEPREKVKDERSAASVDHVVQVAASESFALARWRSGRVFSWGSNESGQLGRRGGLAGVPAPVEGFEHIKAVDIAAGLAQALAICHANSIPGDYAIEKQEEVDRLRFVHGPGSAAVMMDERPGSTAVSAPGAALGHHPAVNESSRPVRRGWRYRKPRTRGGGGGGVEGDGQVYPVIVNEHHRRDIEDASRDILPHFAGGGPSGLYRGPCWNDGALGDKFVCGPYFMLVGAARSGCNDLFHRLVAGDVGVVAPLQPATEWWDSSSSSSEDPGRDFGWYLQNLSPAADAVSSGRADVVTGEVAPSYLTSSGISVRGKTAQHFLLPELIHAFFPRLKIIVMLRNPIDRWISDFQTIYPPADLPGQAHYHASRWARCLQEKKGPSADFACAHYKSLLPKDLVRSLYAYFLVDWLRIFPQDQVLVLRYEDYKADMQSTLQRVMQFLGLGVATEAQMQLMLAQPDHDAEDQKVGSIVVDDSVRGLLRNFFKHHNELLVNFTGDVRFLWDSK